MSFFDMLILDIILMLFPSICFLIVKANAMNNFKLKTDFWIDIANLTSLFLLIKYCDSNNPYMVLLVNMPFIISVLYNRKYTSSIIAIILIIFNTIIGFSLVFLIFEYLIYLLIFLLLYKKGISVSTILIVFISIKGFFLTIYEYYVLDNNKVLTIIEIFVCLVVFYLVGVLILHIIGMVEKIVTINQSLKELEKEKQLKNSLFKLTHEIKNPIAVCKGYFQLMDYDDINKVKKYNTIIESELNRTLDIMDNFSEYNKIKVNFDIMDLDYLISDTVDSMSSFFKNNCVKVNYKESDEVYINGDYFRLKQVLINVFKNSVESMKNDGIIDIKLSASKRYARVYIRDNGCGMSPDELAKISELFYSSKEKGCGIGVTISKEIINLHKGTIKYESIKGKYTQVMIKLPLLTDLH